MNQPSDCGPPSASIIYQSIFNAVIDYIAIVQEEAGGEEEEEACPMESH